MNSYALSIQPEFDQLNLDLLRYFRRRMQASHWADDLAQETLLRLHQALQTGSVESPRALAFRIAKNLLIDHQRKQNVRQAVATDEVVDFDAIRCPKPSLEALLDQQARLAGLREALGELPVVCRTAFVMNRMEGLSHADIANRLNLSESMVNKHLARAMRHCRDRLLDK